MIANFAIVKGAVIPWIEVNLTKNGIVPMSSQAPLSGCSDKQTDPNWLKLKADNGDDLFNSVKFELWKCGRTPVLIPTYGTCEVSADGYTVRYKWDTQDTQNPGCYYGRFIVEFKENFGKFIWPFQLEAFAIDINGAGGCC